MAGQVRCTIYTRGIWYIWLSDTRPNKLTLFIKAWYFINNTNVDRKAITALATQANLFIIVFADAVRRIGNVASGKWKEKQQHTNKIKRQTATRQFWNRNRNRNRGAINSAISAHKTYLCSSALNYVNTFAANWVVSLSLSQWRLQRCTLCSNIFMAHQIWIYNDRKQMQFCTHTRTDSHSHTQLTGTMAVNQSQSLCCCGLSPSLPHSLLLLEGRNKFSF